MKDRKRRIQYPNLAECYVNLLFELFFSLFIILHYAFTCESAVFTMLCISLSLKLDLGTKNIKCSKLINSDSLLSSNSQNLHLLQTNLTHCNTVPHWHQETLPFIFGFQKILYVSKMAGNLKISQNFNQKIFIKTAISTKCKEIQAQTGCTRNIEDPFKI